MRSKRTSRAVPAQLPRAASPACAPCPTPIPSPITAPSWSSSVPRCEVGHCRVYPSGAMTRGLKGEAMSEMGDMVAHGASPSPTTVAACRVRACSVAAWTTARCSARSYEHCQDEDLVGHGQINEGKVSTRLALEGWPAAGDGAPDRPRHRDRQADRCQAAHPAHLHRPWLEIVRAGKALVFRLPARPLRTTCS